MKPSCHLIATYSGPTAWLWWPWGWCTTPPPSPVAKPRSVGRATQFCDASMVAPPRPQAGATEAADTSAPRGPAPTAPAPPPPLAATLPRPCGTTRARLRRWPGGPALARLTSGSHCKRRKSPRKPGQRPARPYKAAVESRFTVENAKLTRVGTALVRSGV